MRFGGLGLLEELVHPAYLAKGWKPITWKALHACSFEGLGKVEVLILGIRLFTKDALMTLLIFLLESARC